MNPGNPFFSVDTSSVLGRPAFDSERVERLRRAPLDDVTDLDAAYALARLVREEFGTSQSDLRLDKGEIAIALRSLRTVLGRLGITFDPPFRDFGGFQQYWKNQRMTNAGSWGKRREYISGLFEPVLSALEGLESKQAAKLKRREHSATNHITDVSRRRLIDGLVHLWRSIVDKNVKAGIEDEHWWVYWGGVLDEIEFLSRLYDLDQLPSNDDRFATARQDIRQHCIANPADWDSDWIYHDDRFGLNTSDDALLVFLAETLHPVVRPDPVEVKLLHDFYNSVLIHDGYEIVQTGSISGAPVFGYRRIGGGVPGTMKNLIFAADGPKLEFVLGDAVNNDVLVVRNEEFCLVYDRALGTTGLTWGDLLSWWREREAHPEDMDDTDVGRDLYKRLSAALASKPERLLFHTYCERHPINESGAKAPALLPQVYLHIDPKTRRERAGKDSPLARERMDFLLLLPHGARIVLEVDGQQHYAVGMEPGDAASPRLYSSMVAEDRALRLKGYEVYRFGGYELTRDTVAAVEMLQRFFADLFGKHLVDAG